MTTPQHCDHEFVCRFYVDNGPCIQPDILSSVCEHDSRRSRPTPSTDCVKCLEEDRVTMLDLDAAIAVQAREKEILTTLDVVRNAKERYEDDDNATIEDALDDIRYHLEGSLIDCQEKTLRTVGEPR